MHLQRRLGRRDARANFQHVRAEHDLVVRLQMIGVILHERRAAFQPARHDLHRADERGGLPIAFGGETVTVRHQALRRDAGQLHQAVQIFKRRGEAFEIAVRPEMRASRLRCAPLRERIYGACRLFSSRRRFHKLLRIPCNSASTSFSVTSLTTFTRSPTP